MPNVTLVSRLLSVGLTLLLASCDRGADSTNPERYYQVHGIIRGLSPDREIVEIQHEDVPGFMPSMTMPFGLRNKKEMSERKIGEAISFRMIVSEKELLIDQVKPIKSDALHLPTETVPPNEKTNDVARLKEGDRAPSVALTNQDGEQISLEKFRGNPLVLTFIFTRCPIPKFCPLVSQHFVELQDVIKTATAPMGQTRLLSITLDPAFDTPTILKQYAASLVADPKMWTFATGEPGEIDRLVGGFSVYRQPEGGTISHGLATVLIGRDGTIQKIWRGNGWTSLDITGTIEANGDR
jgi:protein SCO1/2